MIKITSPLTIKGTSVELTDVVSRLEFYCPMDGKKIQVSNHLYASEAAYNNGDAEIQVNEFGSEAKWFDLALGTTPETYDPQSTLIAHNKVKEDLESLNLTVEIINL